MRLIALSIIVLAGALMAGAGVIAENLPNTHWRNELDVFGLLLIGFACLLFTVEWFLGVPRQRPVRAEQDEADSPTRVA